MKNCINHLKARILYLLKYNYLLKIFNLVILILFLQHHTLYTIHTCNACIVKLVCLYE